jgi:hypothetical protein
MLFAEKKNAKGYGYDVEDWFGKIHIESEKQLKPNQLDMAVVGITQANAPNGKIGETITFTYEKRDQWEEDEIVEIQEVRESALQRFANFIKKLWK